MERWRPLDLDTGGQTARLSMPEPHAITQSTGIYSRQIVVQNLSNEDLVQRVSLLESRLEKFESFFRINTVSLNTLGNDKWELRQPLIVSIEHRGESDFVACLYDFNLYGYGETIPESLDDLKEAIINQYEYLLKKENKLQFGSSIQKQLNSLKKSLVNLDV
jgi:hypothetical protein